jgi:hypothetical protein
MQGSVPRRCFVNAQQRICNQTTLKNSVQCAWGWGGALGNFPKLWRPGEARGELIEVNCLPL